MIAGEIREGDIVEIEYIAEFTKEHVNKGKALVIWKGFNHQPLVRKLSAKKTIWTCYEHIARVVGHVDIEDYMDNVLEQESCEDAVSLDGVIDTIEWYRTNPQHFTEDNLIEDIKGLPPVTPKEKTGHWIETGNKGHIDVDNTILYQEMCDKCKGLSYFRKSCGKLIGAEYCPNCKAKMESEE